MKILIVAGPHYDSLARSLAHELSAQAHTVQVAWPRGSLRVPPWSEQHDVIIAMPWHTLLWLSQHFSRGAGIACLDTDILPDEMEHFAWTCRRADAVMQPAGGIEWTDLLEELSHE